MMTFITVTLRLSFGKLPQCVTNVAWLGSVAFTDGPAFALTGAIAIGCFSLVVKKDLLRREGQINAICR